VLHWNGILTAGLQTEFHAIQEMVGLVENLQDEDWPHDRNGRSNRVADLIRKVDATDDDNHNDINGHEDDDHKTVSLVLQRDFSNCPN
jgi:hypothetical protein